MNTQKVDSTKRKGRKLRKLLYPLGLLVLIAVLALTMALPAMAETTPSVWTDKPDYEPGETVVISGSGFTADTDLVIRVTRPDGSVITGDGSGTPGSDTVTTDGEGNFTYNYILDGIMGIYTVEVMQGEVVLATTTFTDDWPVPDLVSPSNGTTTSDNTVDLDWSEPFLSYAYQVEVDNNADFSSPEYDSGQISNSYATTAALSSGTYYWHARALFFWGWESYSSSWTFTVTSVPSAPTLYNTGGTEQLSFNNVKQHTTTPRFRASATYTTNFNRFQIELNTQVGFGGTAYTETFSGTYSSGTQYNLLCDTLSPSLPTTDGQTYYVRARASADGGSNWGPWSSGTWSFTYNAANEDPMWFQTTDEQFDTGNLINTETYGSDQVRLSSCGYTERFDTWSASTSDTWEEKDLSAYGVPPNAVCEIVIQNSRDDRERYGGVRATGSSIDRRAYIAEAEGGGQNILIMHVQADGESKIEHYADSTSDISFILVGYWTCATYVEKWESFAAGASGSWQDRDLSGYGVGANKVVEIVMTNDDTSNERSAGVRQNGSSLQRRISIQEAEDGGVCTATMMVSTDAGSIIEAYAQDNSDIDFYLAGYWSSPPGTYTEKFNDITIPTSDHTWQDRNLSGAPWNVPGNAVAEIVFGNQDTDEEDEMGVRQNGSTLSRYLDIVECEAGGLAAARMHVKADASSIIEVYHEDVSDSHAFYLAGYWQLVSTGTITSPAIDFDSFVGATDWNELLFTDVETSSDIKYNVEYWDGGSWQSTGITNEDDSPVDISSLDPATHNPIRIKATLTTGSTPYLQDWIITTSAAGNPVPTITSISPASKTYGDAGFTMTVNGTNFISSSVVRFDGSDRTTTYVSATQLTASIPASDLAAVGSFSITVFNPTPGGGTSNAATFTVSKRPIEVTADPQSKVYGEADPALTYTVTSGSLVFSDYFTGALSRDAGEDVGTYAINQGTLAIEDGNSGNNYDLTYVGDDLTITPKSVDPYITANDKVYDSTTTATLSAQWVTGVIAPDVVTLVVGMANFADEHVGTWTVTATSLSLGGADKDNYVLSAATATDTAEITQRDLTVSATGIDKVYDGTTNATVTLSTDKVSGDDVTASYTSAYFADANVGTWTVSVSGISISGTDTINYNLLNTSATTTASITPAPTTTTVTVTPTSIEWMDEVDFSATVTGTPGPLTGTVTFSIGSITYDTVALSAGSAALNDKQVVNLPVPDTFTVTATFTSTDPNYSGSSDGTPLYVDTRVASPYSAFGFYSGDRVAWTTNENSNSATVKLAATIVDFKEPQGDVREATVTFLMDGKPIPSAQNLPVGLVNPDDPMIGSAGAIVQFNKSKKEDSETFDITVVVGGAYENDTTDILSHCLVTIVTPVPGGRIFGGSVTLMNSNSAGIIEGADGDLTWSAFDIQYNKSLKNPQGKAYVLISSDRNSDGEVDGESHVYLVSSNAIDVLSTGGGEAVFSSKCTIKEWNDSMLTWDSIEGGALLDITMTDNNLDNNPMTPPDTIGITVLANKNNGGLWFSSNWNTLYTIEQEVYGDPDQLLVQ